MHHPAQASQETRRESLGDLGAAAFRAAVLAGSALMPVGVGLALAGSGDPSYLLHSYLVSYAFWLSISLGGLFFVAVQHVTRAGWSVTVRRLSEIVASNMTLLTVLFLPVFVPVVFGVGDLYEWTNPAAVAHDPLLEHKAPYLNVPFFGLRCVAYFLVWWALARFFLARSTEQDTTGDVEETLRMERASPVALILYAVTVTFAAFDLLMSLEPHWFSTIFGIYYFSGAVVGFLAVLILAAIGLQATGRLTDWITVEHYHDLGKLLFGFVFFWGYIAFSQYMLIWYANIPEETVWYLKRQEGPWMYVALALLFGHLLIPFLGLLPRVAKRRKVSLAFWAAWLLWFHWLDLYWIVMPEYWAHAHTDHAMAPSQAALCVAGDLCLWGGVGAAFLAGSIRVAGQRSLVPLRDPRLGEAAAFENV